MVVEKIATHVEGFCLLSTNIYRLIFACLHFDENSTHGNFRSLKVTLPCFRLKKNVANILYEII